MFLLTFPIVANSKSINGKSIDNTTTLEKVKLEAGVSKIIFSDIEIKEWNSGWANENIFELSMFEYLKESMKLLQNEIKVIGDYSIDLALLSFAFT